MRSYQEFKYGMPGIDYQALANVLLGKRPGVKDGAHIITSYTCQWIKASMYDYPAVRHALALANSKALQGDSFFDCRSTSHGVPFCNDGMICSWLGTTPGMFVAAGPPTTLANPSAATCRLDRKALHVPYPYPSATNPLFHCNPTPTY